MQNLEEMEEKLAAYRAKKAKEYESSIGFGGSLISRFRGNQANASTTRQPQSTQDTAHSSSSDHGDTLHHSSSAVVETAGSSESRTSKKVENAKAPLISPNSYLGRLVYGNNLFHLFIKFVLWCALFGLFICIGFGAVFFILSIFYVIYANMRSGHEKVPGEKSAYSVFNPDCERLQGTLTAEEIEKGMLYGIGGAMR